VFFADGPIWREQRRFTLRNLRDFGFGRRSMENIIHEECHALLRNVDTTDPEFDLLPLLPFSTINVLWTIMTGRRHDFEDKDFLNLTRAVMDFFRYGNPISPVNESTLLQKIPIINASYEKQLKSVNQVVRYIQVLFGDVF
jgi:cytochrome P450